MYRTAQKSLSRGLALAVTASLLIFLHAGPVRAQWMTSGTDIYNTNTGKVGLGTSKPQGKFQFQMNVGEDVRYASNGTTTPGRITPAVSNWWGFTNNAYYAGGQWYLDDISRGGSAIALDGTFAANPYIWLGGWTPGDNPRNSAQWYGLWLDIANRKVGVGTHRPETALHVVGDVTVTGNISARYQDVAEWVPTLRALPAGTVVVLDAEHNNHVTTSATAYDTRVAGVVSAQPGLALGERGEGKALVATTGRVKVRVDATRAPIRVGDLLVTSGTPGVAMRSEPLELGGVPIHRPGTIIGKALEPLAKGTGEILVLLSLQ